MTIEKLNLYTIEPELVVVENRQRQHFDRKKLAELTESVRRLGQLQPALCRQVDGRVILIAGERRLRACAELEIPFTYVLKEEILDPYTLKEMELTENIERDDITWQERSNAMEELHVLYEKQHREDPTASGKWTLKDSATRMGRSVGSVQEAIKTSVFAKSIPEVAKASSQKEAKKIIDRLNSTVTRGEDLREALAKSREPSPAVKDEGLQPVEESGTTSEQRILLEFDRRTLHGPWEEKSESFHEGTFDCVIFDPPWGVGFLEKESGGSTQKYEDKEDIIWEDMGPWLSTIFRLMKEDSHLYFVFGIVHHERAYSLLEEVGFQTNRMPIFWKKAGSHRTRAPEIWPGRCYEAIAYCRKGKKPLAQFGRPDIVETPMPTPKMKLSHPSAKHPDLYRDLLQRSCSPGDAVLDPMCGSGMFGVAADSLHKELALDWFQVEKNQQFRELALYNAVRGYATIIGEKEEVVTSEEFKGLIPGTPEWRNFWDAHPELQDEMTDWMDKMKGGK